MIEPIQDRTFGDGVLVAVRVRNTKNSSGSIRLLGDEVNRPPILFLDATVEGEFRQQLRGHIRPYELLPERFVI